MSIASLLELAPHLAKEALQARRVRDAGGRLHLHGVVLAVRIIGGGTVATLAGCDIRLTPGSGRSHLLARKPSRRGQVSTGNLIYMGRFVLTDARMAAIPLR